MIMSEAIINTTIMSLDPTNFPSPIVRRLPMTSLAVFAGAAKSWRLSGKLAGLQR
jgi:hypothetical protein